MAHQELQSERETSSQVSTTKSWVPFILAVLEAACVFAVTAAKAGLVLGSIAAVAAGWTVHLHKDYLRIPVLLIAIIASLLNLYLLWKFFRLRNAPAAAWRKQGLTARERLRIGVVISFSVVTLAIALLEIHLHRSFHHTVM